MDRMTGRMVLPSHEMGKAVDKAEFGERLQISYKQELRIC